MYLTLHSRLVFLFLKFTCSLGKIDNCVKIFQTIASGKAQIDESLKAQVAALCAPSGAQCSRNSLSSPSGVLSPRSWSSNALACRITGRAPNPTDAPQPTIASPTLYFEKSFNLFEGCAPNSKPMAPELDLQQPELSTTLYHVTPSSPRLLADKVSENEPACNICEDCMYNNQSGLL
jgi:hypothetical protein